LCVYEQQICDSCVWKDIGILVVDLRMLHDTSLVAASYFT